MSITTLELLKAASEIAGGEQALANALGVSRSLMTKFMNGSHPLPDPLLLRAVDIILADRQNLGRGVAAPEIGTGPGGEFA
jgi:hypothetical protein